jgi:hypothetical protein
VYIVDNPKVTAIILSLHEVEAHLSVDTVIGCFVEFEGKENRPKEKDTVQVQHS